MSIDQRLAILRNASDFLESRGHLGGLYSINDEDRGAFFRKSLCHREADSLRRTGYQDVFQFYSF
jgi:hypothetical protein